MCVWQERARVVFLSRSETQPPASERVGLAVMPEASRAAESSEWSGLQVKQWRSSEEERECEQTGERLESSRCWLWLVGRASKR